MTFKNFKFYLILAAIVIVGFFLLFNKAVVTGLIILGAGALVFSAWEFFLKEREQKIDQLTSEIQRMKVENSGLKKDIDELAHRKLNITEVHDILDLGLVEVDTSFKRTVNRNFSKDGRNVQFIGVLHVDFVAKYGVDIRNLKYKIDEESKEISIANANPRFLSFSKRNCVWEIAEMMEFNEPFFGANHWKTNPKLDRLANEIKEEIRMQTERETENGPKELEWLIRPLHKHVESALEMILGKQGYRIKLTELDAGNYIPLEASSGKNQA